MDKDHGAHEGAGGSHAPSNMVKSKEDDVPDPDEEDLDGLDGPTFLFNPLGENATTDLVL